MNILVTGSAGHLGEALMRVLRASHHQPIGVDIKPSPFTDHVGSVSDRDFVRECVDKADAIIHTATLHKPHVGTHSRQDFIDTNITGTLNLLEEAAAQGLKPVVFTSTTSTFGDAMKPPAGGPAVWVTESLRAKPKNIYGVTKTAAEDLCQLFHRNANLPCIVLKTSRFFPEADDDKGKRDAFDDTNLKVNELLFRRVDVQDIVDAHLLALDKATRIGFDRFIISAHTPFAPEDAALLGSDAPRVVAHYYPEYASIFAIRGWRMLPRIERVYDSAHAQDTLGWTPRYSFEAALNCLKKNREHRSQLSLDVGGKGYHDVTFDEGPYPTRGF